MDFWLIIQSIILILTISIIFYQIKTVRRAEFKLQKTIDDTLVINNYLFTEKYLVDSVKTSKNEINILGTNLKNIFFRTNSNYYSSIKDAALRGVNVRILIFIPESRLISPESPELIDQQETQSDIKRVIMAYTNLAKHSKELNIQLKFYSDYVPYFIFITDNTLCYSPKVGKTTEPSYILTHDPNHKLFSAFKNYFDNLWNESTDINKALVKSG